MLVTVCEYEQNISRGVGGVAHTRFRVVRTYGEVQILMPTHYSILTTCPKHRLPQNGMSAKAVFNGFV